MGLLQTSRQQPSGPQIFFALFDFTTLVGGSIWDVPFQLPFPCKTFFLCSIKGGDEANSFVMYFQALNKPRGTSFATLNGNEQIFYLNTTNIVSGPFYRSVLRFKEPVLNFFVAAGSENGETSRYTLACCQDDEVNLRGGLYT